MIRFFIDDIPKKNYILSGENAHHAIKSLRVRTGEKIILCDKNSIEYTCNIEKIFEKNLHLNVISSQPCESEPKVKITLYQSLTKGDKMDWIIQKSVELGVFEVVPVITKRCISRPDKKSLLKKIERWQKISNEAAQQSGRGIIPKISSLTNLIEVAHCVKKYDNMLVFYENGGKKIKDSLNITSSKNIALLVGPEGGFEKSEIELLQSYNAKISTLGKRILRTETAPIAAIAIITNIFEN